MNFSQIKPPQINLSRRRFEEPFFVDMEAFFEFSFWISEELLDLEAQQKLNSKRIRDVNLLPAAVLARGQSV